MQGWRVELTRFEGTKAIRKAFESDRQLSLLDVRRAWLYRYRCFFSQAVIPE